MKYFRLTPLVVIAAFIFALVTSVNAQVQVSKVNFNKGPEDWIIIEIEIQAGDNTDPKAPNSNFVDDILVEFIIANEIDRSSPAFDPKQPFWFYHSAARIVSIEKNEKKLVHFFLPGVIAERDNVRKTPEYWYVNISVAGNELEPDMNRQASSKLRAPQTYSDFRDMASGAIGDNEGIMLPFYQAPTFVLPRIDAKEIPAYYRLDETR